MTATEVITQLGGRATWSQVRRWTIETLVAELDRRPTAPPPREVRRAVPA